MIFEIDEDPFIVWKVLDFVLNLIA
jgi:hypothetical protein